MNDKSTFEDYLKKKGKLTYDVKGISMYPWLKEGRDFFTVEPKSDKRFQKFDVVLYRRDPGQYVLHRIIQVRETDYVILGDNSIKKEVGIKDEDILGIMTSFVRDCRKISVNNKIYQLLVRIWYYIYPLRILWKKIKGKVRRL